MLVHDPAVQRALPYRRWYLSVIPTKIQKFLTHPYSSATIVARVTERDREKQTPKPAAHTRSKLGMC